MDISEVDHFARGRLQCASRGAAWPITLHHSCGSIPIPSSTTVAERLLDGCRSPIRDSLQTHDTRAYTFNSQVEARRCSGLSRSAGICRGTPVTSTPRQFARNPSRRAPLARVLIWDFAAEKISRSKPVMKNETLMRHQLSIGAKLDET